MHRNISGPRTAHWKCLLGLLLGGLLIGRAAAQEAPTVKVQGLLVPINGTKSVTTAKKTKLKTVTNSDPGVARVSASAEDPTQVLITGLKPGLTRITLVDVMNNQEVYDVVVQTNVEHLQNILRRVAPTSNLQLIPASENTIVINGTVASAEDVDRIIRTAQSVGGYTVINNMKVGGVSQVQLCVVVAQVSRSEFRRMAFNFIADGPHSFFGSTVGQAVSNPALVGVGSATNTINGVLAGVPGVPNGAPTNLFFGVLNTHDGFIAFLQALKDENVLKLLAEPKLVTMSGRPASFLSGGEQAVPVPAGLGQVGVQFEEFGTRLNFLPIVLANGKIHLEVEPEVSNLNAANGTSISGVTVPGRDTQRIHTTVELEDGQTFAIGGLIQRNVTGTITKIPVVGDLPFVGALFSSKAFNEVESELVILVTPRLVDPMACNQLPKYLPGRETRSPDDFELFLEGILEAPRGQREVFQDRHYVPAFKNGPTANEFPCGDNGGHCGTGRCTTGNCGTGNCGAGNCTTGNCTTGNCGTGNCGSGCTPGCASQPSAKPPVRLPVVKAEDVPAAAAQIVPVTAQESGAMESGVIPVPEMNSAALPQVLGPEGSGDKQ